MNELARTRVVGIASLVPLVMASNYSERDLTFVPFFTYTFVEDYLKSKSRSSGEKHMSKGVLYKTEKYISEIKVSPTDDGCVITSKCYHSQAKNESSHNVKVELAANPVGVIKGSCTCKVGLGEHCGHLAALLYQLAEYKVSGIKAVPVDLVKTSLKGMDFHQPRGEKIPNKKIEDLTIRGHSRRCLPVRPINKELKSTLYNAVNGGIPDLQAMGAELEKLSPLMPILPVMKANINEGFVESKFGKVPKGSVLGIQQKLHSDVCLNILDNVPFPDLPLTNLMKTEYQAVLNQRQTADLEGLSISMDDCHQFQELTLEQSNDPLWFKIRANRLTASKIGRVKSRRDDFVKLAGDLKSTRKVTTKAMQRGIDLEPTAASKYAQLKKNNINLLPCGVVVSVWCPWLAASPDRRVYDPSKIDPFGLLEIKCPNVSSVLEAKELKRDKVSGALSLNKNHAYYFQILMQLAVTGLPWCDLLVYTENDYHLETFIFDSVLWQEVKNKADKFYFEYFL